MDARTRVRTRRLPHWDVPGAIYFVTACLDGSIPAQGLADLREHRLRLARRPRPDDVSEEDWDARLAKLQFALTDEWLDRRPGVRHFAEARLAQVVVDSIGHFAGRRYDVWAYVVMPSHFHWVFRERPEWVASLGAGVTKRPPRERIMHTLKLHTALECNKLLGTSGPFWQDESYDHCVRDEDELMRIVEYVEMNPVRAGLVASPELWRYSSAFERRSRGISLTAPLLR